MHSSTITNRSHGSIVILLGIFGIVPYLTFVFLVCTRKQFNSPYYKLAAYLGIAECTTLVVMIGYTGPCILMNYHPIQSRYVGSLLNLAWFTACTLVLILAGDRYICICHSFHHHRVFSKSLVKVYIAVCIMIGLSVGVPSVFEICELRFDTYLWTWGWAIERRCATILNTIEIAMVLSVASITLLLNCLVIRYIRLTRRRTFPLNRQAQRQTIRERRIFVQFFLATSWLIMFDVLFVSFGYISSSPRWLGFLVTLFYTINCSINSWVYFALNKQLQKEFRKLWCKSRRISSITEDTNRTTFERNRSSREVWNVNKR